MTESRAKLRVAQLVEELSVGGAESLAVNIAEALARRGHDSHLIVVRNEGPLSGRVSVDLRFHDLQRPRCHGGQVARVGAFLATSRQLHRTLARERIDVLQTHLPMANFLGLTAAWRGMCRAFPTVHNNREFDYGDSAGPARRALRRQGYRFMVQSCTGVIAVSDLVRTSLADQLGLRDAAMNRISVVRNGVRIPEPAADRERVAARERWAVSPDEVLIVAVGRLTRQKNFGALVEALTHLDQGAVPWRCVIAGEGDLRQELTSQIAERNLADRIVLAGLVTAVDELLVAADVFCLPSIFEGLPLVLLEAMAQGLPVVAFAIDGVTDVVVDGVQARLVASGDVDNLALALGTLAGDANMRRALGESGRRTVRERFDFEGTIDAIEALYHGDRTARREHAC